jgi:hypothetical protein
VTASTGRGVPWLALCGRSPALRLPPACVFTYRHKGTPVPFLVLSASSSNPHKVFGIAIVPHDVAKTSATHQYYRMEADANMLTAHRWRYWMLPIELLTRTADPPAKTDPATADPKESNILDIGGTTRPLLPETSRCPTSSLGRPRYHRPPTLRI